MPDSWRIFSWPGLTLGVQSYLLSYGDVFDAVRTAGAMFGSSHTEPEVQYD